MLFNRDLFIKTMEEKSITRYRINKISSVSYQTLAKILETEEDLNLTIRTTMLLEQAIGLEKGDLLGEL